MDIDELIEAMRKISPEKQLVDLAQYLGEWKHSDQTVEELETMVEKFFGNTWSTTQEIHTQVYTLWNSFKENTIHGIGGMTMNERLYIFGLFERFDASKSQKEKDAVYAKVHAHP